MRILSNCIFLFMILLTGRAAADTPRLTRLLCERLEDPLGIDAPKPRLGWEIESGSSRGVVQLAYQVLVASSPGKLAEDKGDLWSSGKIMSSQSQLVDYAGAALTSRRTCYWKVRVWTNRGESEWSKPAAWSMGLLEQTDWTARWIGYAHGFPWDSVSKFSRLSARYFRKTFQSADSITRATVYIIGLGHYELFINGRKIGNQVLAESPTDYTKSVKYNTFDVTGDCRQGQNAIGVVLGNGRFFTMRPKYKPNKIKEFGFPELLFQLEITYADGHIQRIVSDDNWRFDADGPIRTNNEYDGEEYDATKELTGWNEPGFDDGHWLRPELVTPPGGRIDAQMNEPIRVMRIVKPVSITESQPGTWILDMGQNMAGWLQIHVHGQRGDKVVLRFAETLQKDGSLYTANLRDAKATDSYTLKGSGEETWHPVFVFHGFRYAEISGYPGNPSRADFEGQVVYDAMDSIGEFKTSNPLINSVYRNASWGIRNDYKGMPVDCPQRNERMPWLGDRAVGSLGESFVLDNENLYAKWLDDIQESQKPDGSLPDVAPAYWNYYSDNITWPGTYILIADMLYRQYGDRAPLERHYASMKKWLDYMRDRYDRDGLMTKDKYGDWCVPPESPELIHSRDSSRNTDGVLIATASYFHLLGLMEGFARMLGFAADARTFAAQAEEARGAFNKTFLHSAGVAGSGGTAWYGNNTVTANLLPLYFGMTPLPLRAAIVHDMTDRIENVDKDHISTGVIGTQWLMRGLTDFGRPDLAYRIASNSDYPSWGYMVKQGATTIWELWNGNTANPSMNSQDHIMLLGDLIAWFYEDLGGISAAEPGFKKILMKPAMPEGLSAASADYHCPYGVIKSAWTRGDDGLTWNIGVPANTTALVYIPAESVDEVYEGGKAVVAGTSAGSGMPSAANGTSSAESGIRFVKMEDGRAVLEVGSGEYTFKIEQHEK
jgi:alpha-L-rhamnosidase